MGRFEDPLLDRFGDDDGGSQGNEGNLGPLDQRHHGHGRSGRRSTDDDVDVVVADEAFDRRLCFLRIGPDVVVDQFDLAAEHPAAFVDLGHIGLEGLDLGIAEERGRSGDRKKTTDADGAGGVHLGRREDNRAYGQGRQKPGNHVDGNSLPLFSELYRSVPLVFAHFTPYARKSARVISPEAELTWSPVGDSTSVASFE